MMSTTYTTLSGQDVSQPQTTPKPEVSVTVSSSVLSNSAAKSSTSAAEAAPLTKPATATYDSSGAASSGGVTTAPTTTGLALEGALAGMIGDIRGRQNAEVPVPGMPNNTETQTVVVRDNAGHSNVLLIGTLICVAASAVTLWQAHKHGGKHHGK